MTMLSDNFSYEEAISSETGSRVGISNIPSLEILEVMKKSALKLEKVRALFNNNPIHINSWYRCPILNSALGSKSTSQHLKGEAIDFIIPSVGTPLELCKKIKYNCALIQYDQLILEHSWVHISFDITNNKPRNQILSLLINCSYAEGLTDIRGNIIG